MVKRIHLFSKIFQKRYIELPILGLLLIGAPIKITYSSQVLLIRDVAYRGPRPVYFSGFLFFSAYFAKISFFLKKILNNASLRGLTISNMYRIGTDQTLVWGPQCKCGNDDYNNDEDNVDYHLTEMGNCIDYWKIGRLVEDVGGVAYDTFITGECDEDHYAWTTIFNKDTPLTGDGDFELLSVGYPPEN